MAKKKNPIGFKNYDLAAQPGTQVTSGGAGYASMVAPKSISQARQDIQSWKKGEMMALKQDEPKWYLIQLLFKDILKDALLTSQYQNRLLKGLSQRMILKKPNGDVDEDQSEMINNMNWTSELNQHIIDSIFFETSLVDLLPGEGDNEVIVQLVPRENVNPRDGYFYPDYMEDKYIKYRELSEYGWTLLEFGKPGNLGLLNKAVPHVLFKRFAQSCWSELCEINGIPPRVLKTNTQDPTMMRRGEAMMRDMGSAAWFIIDENETFEWAAAATQSGDVYKNLIQLCDSELSMLMSGAMIGMDTKNGSRSKDESAREMLQVLIEGDLDRVRTNWNTKVIPALQKLGILKGDLIFDFEQTEDIDQLWTMTKEVLPYKNIDDAWLKEKFGIEVTGDRQQAAPGQNLSLDFFD